MKWRFKNRDSGSRHASIEVIGNLYALLS